jgi:hypothetical protein
VAEVAKRLVSQRRLGNPLFAEGSMHKSLLTVLCLGPRIALAAFTALMVMTVTFRAGHLGRAAALGVARFGKRFYNRLVQKFCPFRAWVYGHAALLVATHAALTHRPRLPLYSMGMGVV